MEFVNLMSSLSLNSESDNIQCEKTSNHLIKPISAKINDIQTEIIHGEYNDRTLLIISQFGKIGGSMYLVSKDQGSDINNQLTEPVYQIKSLFGTDELLHQVAARYFAERFNITKPMIIFLCLKSYEKVMLNAVCDVILNH